MDFLRLFGSLGAVSCPKGVQLSSVSNAPTPHNKETECNFRALRTVVVVTAVIFFFWCVVGLGEPYLQQSIFLIK